MHLTEIIIKSTFKELELAEIMKLILKGNEHLSLKQKKSKNLRNFSESLIHLNTLFQKQKRRKINGAK